MLETLMSLQRQKTGNVTKTQPSGQDEQRKQVSPVSREAKHDLTSMSCIQEETVPSLGANHHMVGTLPIT